MNKRIREKVSKRHAAEEGDDLHAEHAALPVGQAVAELRASAFNLARALLADVQGRLDEAFSRVWVKLAPASEARRSEPPPAPAEHATMLTPNRSHS